MVGGFKMKKRSKNSTCKTKFYLPILNRLSKDTNLSKIKKEFNISKQDLNYYLRGLKKKGLVIHKGRGWYEPVKQSKKSTKYENFLSKDSVRGHAYAWNVKLEEEVVGWNKRIEILKKKGMNFILVGAMKTTPRIKVLGRKVWLCNDHLRVFSKPKESYYGETAKESRNLAFQEIKLIVGVLNNKLGLFVKPSSISFQKEHYALIKNDLAIEYNKRKDILRIKDEEGEWLIVDDSFGEGGELENIGKKAYPINIPMQKWWNDNKEHNFKVTPTFVLENFNKLIEDRKFWAEHQKSHISSIQQLGSSANANSKTTELLAGVIKELSTQMKDLTEEVRTLKNGKNKNN